MVKPMCKDSSANNAMMIALNDGRMKNNGSSPQTTSTTL